ncbi:MULTISPECIES: FG-GAP-like repeat-containing protein [unclassified Lentimicrobium]|uniref:FG-GAP-like repeat-containing protein n=1 Tax=unclassified Lentimicrobium TaxID=2677434 RepID=UPI001554CE54|nr:MULTISPECIES: FG-GAP-like repeat-containing protein [unclassified Lentimicrobium]NPD46998.1 T9SS type A sorting domain-containing protein [Lentimicrobium sp. S6]NPD83909.1 T9SS type A sorting domain-containing protein [Lentimicrobium sp. L6]
MKKYLFFLLALVFVSFTSDRNKSKYNIPILAFSTMAGDIDLDGDNDIIVGHRIYWLLDSPVITVLDNMQSGEFSISDTIKDFYAYQYNIILADVDNDDFPDIIGLGIDASEEISEMFIRVLYNSGGEYNSYQDFALNTHEPISDIDYGDINGDGHVDLAITSNHGQFWGVLYNDGIGNFSAPEYYETEGAYPNSIDCGDINSDGRADIVLIRQSVEVFFSTVNGFENITLEEGSSWKHAAKIVDFDLDGENDIITFGGTPVTLLDFYKNIENNNLEVQEEFVGYFQSSEFQICDINNNEYQDVVFELLDKTGYVIYYNQGNFQLADSQFIALPAANPEEQWRSFFCADMDGNGFQDIICVKTVDEIVSDNLEILFNDGEGNFIENPIAAINNININKSSLSANPNPFTEQTQIHFTLEKASLVLLEIFNLKGELVWQLEKKYTAGKQSILWNGKDQNGNNCKPGAYIIKILNDHKTPNTIQIIKQ